MMVQTSSEHVYTKSYLFGFEGSHLLVYGIIFFEFWRKISAEIHYGRGKVVREQPEVVQSRTMHPYPRSGSTLLIRIESGIKILVWTTDFEFWRKRKPAFRENWIFRQNSVWRPQTVAPSPKIVLSDGPRHPPDGLSIGSAGRHLQTGFLDQF